MDSTKKDLLSGDDRKELWVTSTIHLREHFIAKAVDSSEIQRERKTEMKRLSVVRTGCHRTNQDSVELDDGTENVLGVGSCSWVLSMELEDKTLVLLLQ